MTVSPRALVWQRVDTIGAEQVVVDERDGLHARGVAVAGAPLAYSCRYDLTTDNRWSSDRFEVTVEGAGWTRTVRLARSGTSWTVRTSEKGDLDAALHAAGHPAASWSGIEEPSRLDGALDVDLWASPLTNTLPLRRANLLAAEPGTTVEALVAWVLLPSLEIIPSRQRYTLVAPGRVRYASGNFAAELEVDPDGYVLRYPGLATR